MTRIARQRMNEGHTRLIFLLFIVDLLLFDMEKSNWFVGE